LSTVSLVRERLEVEPGTPGTIVET